MPLQLQNHHHSAGTCSIQSEGLLAQDPLPQPGLAEHPAQVLPWDPSEGRLLILSPSLLVDKAGPHPLTSMGLMRSKCVTVPGHPEQSTWHNVGM